MPKSVNLKETYFSANLSYLFDILKSRKGILKNYFFTALNINKSTEHRWHQRQSISPKSLRATVQYFNDHLELNLTVEKLLNDDLAVMRLQIREADPEFHPQSEQQLLENYRKMSAEKKLLLVKLIEIIAGTEKK